MVKYPRTRHLAGSKLQPGDEDLTQVPISELRGLHLVIEEKIDGSNAGLSFDPKGGLLIQSRGHYLRGGSGERQFDLLKSWGAMHQDELRRVLAERFVMYGEWVYAHHTMYYDALPHYFLEFDVLDRQTMRFLGTPERRALLGRLGFVRSVPVLFEGTMTHRMDLATFVRASLFRTGAWAVRMREAAITVGADPERAVASADPSLLAEGLYIKHEEGGCVMGRYKFIRAGFLQTVVSAGEHWKDRPLIPNGLAGGPESAWAS
jgi:hypothetical protein